MKKKIFIFCLFVLFLSGCSLFSYTLPHISFCGIDKEITPGKVSKIYYIEDTICDSVGGESFATEDEAKAKYGVGVDLAEAPTEQVIGETKNFTLYPNQKTEFGDSTITIMSTDASSTQIDVDGEVQTILSGESGVFGNLDIKVSSTCGETYRTVFSVSENQCCEEEQNSEGGEKDIHMERAKQQTEEDLKPEKRNGYKGVILPKAIAKDYPTTDFALLPFTVTPSELCCGCKQEYKNLKMWGEYMDGQALHELISLIDNFNGGSFIEEIEKMKFTLIQRDESGLRDLLNDMNYEEENKKLFDPKYRNYKGHLINPDYVIDGTMKFTCCDNSKYVNVEFTAQLINAKTEKVIKTINYSPKQCFDLVSSPGNLRSACYGFAQDISQMVDYQFGEQRL